MIKQGTEGDYFYVVVSGKCVVTRETPLNKEGIKLAELGTGDSFGEEALIAEAKRNATVTMLTDGTLMRPRQAGLPNLAQRASAPMGQLRPGEADRRPAAASGSTYGSPASFRTFASRDALNIPLYFIRLKLNAIPKDIPYVLCCDTGRRSSAAAYILSERGFEAYVLKGGLSASAHSRGG